ncbi:MAG: YjbQ family protein [Acidobacteria bacterium]|nr:YjbQ family protein [Acidobacteriota bacterium]
MAPAIASEDVTPIIERPVASSAQAATHLRLEVSTPHRTTFVDITPRLSRFVSRSGIRHGVLAIHTLHTTTAIVLNEDEPLLRGDIIRQLERLAPGDVPYAHDDPTRREVNRVAEERVNGHAHCRAISLGASLSLSVVDGAVLLGRWQRILFVDLDGPQVRQVAATIVGAAR